LLGCIDIRIFKNILVGSSKKFHLPLNGLDPKHFEINLKNFEVLTSNHLKMVLKFVPEKFKNSIY
jgi:hypothetical protein